MTDSVTIDFLLDLSNTLIAIVVNLKVGEKIIIIHEHFSYPDNVTYQHGHHGHRPRGPDNRGCTVDLP